MAGNDLNYFTYNSVLEYYLKETLNGYNGAEYQYEELSKKKNIA